MNPARPLVGLVAAVHMGASKAVMGLLGVDVGPPRLPHVGLDAARVAELRRRLEARGFFEWVRPEASR